MTYFLWFVKLRLKIINNNFFKDFNTILKTFLILVGIVFLQIIATRLLHKYLFNNMMLLGLDAKVLVMVFSLIVVFWIYLMSFFQSISSFVRNFFKSPDMNYLISLPISSNYIFWFFPSNFYYDFFSCYSLS